MFIVTHPINYPLKSDYYGYETNLSGNKVKVCHEDSEIVDKEQLAHGEIVQYTTKIL